MDKEEFDRINFILTAAGDTLAGLDLRGYIEAVALDHSMGPVLDPTAYRTRMTLTPLLEERARKALDFVNAHARTKGEAAAIIAKHNER